MNPLVFSYIPVDRRLALASGLALPDRTTGAALFADVFGSTALAEALSRAFGPQRGAEELTRHLDAIYGVLIAEVERYGGSVVSFNGDAITCWFDANLPDSFGGMHLESDDRGAASRRAAWRATASACAMQTAMRSLDAVTLPGGESVSLEVKTAVASGTVRRFVVGDPRIQLIDVLAGTTLNRLAAAEHHAGKGEVVLDLATHQQLADAATVIEWREDADNRYVVIGGLTAGIQPVPWPAPDPSELTEDQVRPWLLPAVYEHERTGKGTFLAELRPAVALFLRFGGIDYDGDDAAGVKLDAYIRWVQGILARYEGTLLQVIAGDKGSHLFAPFGAPLAHDDDPARAVAAAQLLRTPPAELNFLTVAQIGISHGRMRVGPCGGPTRRTYSILGDEVNVAARLMQAAAPGQVLVTQRIAETAGRAFSFTPLPSLQVKGKSQPVPVHALRTDQATQAIRLQEPAYTLPMVGRETELALIQEKIELAAQGKGQLIAVTAEAGMGKSRLLAEAIRLAGARGFIGYAGECQSYGTDTPYLVWHSIWRGFFRLDPAAPPEAQIRALEDELAHTDPSLVPRAPVLGGVLNLPIPDNDLTRTFDTRLRKESLEALLLDCVRAKARFAPTLFVLEDCHWLDALSHELLEKVARAAADLPLLILLAYRPSEVSRLQAPRVTTLPHCTVVELRDLTPDQATRLIELKLAELHTGEGKNAALSAFAERISEQAQGNPFYIEELLNYVRDRGVDLNTLSTPEGLDLPDSLHRVILNRIDQLDDSQKVVLKVASIVGRLFPVNWLWGVYPELGEAERVQVDLNVLDRLDITPLDRTEPDLRYLFKHIVTWEVAYESQPYMTRARFHEHLARYLEGRYADTLFQYIDLLAYHYSRSENAAKQREYFRKAGEQAARQYANEQAVAYLTRALALTPPTDLAERYELLLARENVYDLQGARTAQAEDLATLDTLAGQLADAVRQAKVAIRKLSYATTVSDFPAAQLAGQQALARAQASGSVLLEADAHRHLGVALWHQANYVEARLHSEQALSLARAIQNREIEAGSLVSLGIIADLSGDRASAQSYFQQALILARQGGDRKGESRALSNLGVVAWRQSKYAEAEAYFRQSLQKDQELGDYTSVGKTLSNLAIVADSQGDYARTRHYAEQGLQIHRETGNRYGESRTLGILGNVFENQGDLLAARAAFEQGLRVDRESGDRQDEAHRLDNLGYVAIRLGQHDESRAFSEEALRLSREIGERDAEMFALRDLALLFFHTGEAGVARAYSEQALQLAREIGGAEAQAVAWRFFGNACLALGQLEAAAGAYQQAWEQQRAARESDPAIEPRIGLASVNLVQGDIAGAMAHVEAILAHLGPDGLNGTDEPFRVYLTCYRVLRAARDARANEVLEHGYTVLQLQANRIEDEALRRTFLENVPWHRELVAEWKVST